MGPSTSSLGNATANHDLTHIKLSKCIVHVDRFGALVHLSLPCLKEMRIHKVRSLWEQDLRSSPNVYPPLMKRAPWSSMVQALSNRQGQANIEVLELTSLNSNSVTRKGEPGEVGDLSMIGATALERLRSLTIDEGTIVRGASENLEVRYVPVKPGFVVTIRMVQQDED